MAKVTDVFVSGSVGNLIFYRRMGKNCARLKRVHLRQTVATKKRGVNFGVASRAGKALRSGLRAAMPIPTDRNMQNRFSGSIAKWIGLSDIDKLLPDEKVPFVSGLAFTKEQPFGERCKVPVTISQPHENTISVSIEAFVPALKISAPAGTQWITWIISVSACHLENGRPSGSGTRQLEISYNDFPVPAQVLEFEVGAPGSLIVTAARLIYKKWQNNSWVAINKEAFMPAGVIDARYREA
jgi:hypothetical protein